jgi:hypothetical protein
MERRATKKRIKMLRWLKKAIVDKGEEDATVIGDIYRIEGPDNHVKLWCLLRDRQLYCYRRVTDTTHDSVIPLDNCTAVPSAVISGQKYAFDIKREGVKLVTFAARSSKEQARWIEIVKSKRGKIPLAEIEDESGEEAAGSGTSEEDDDDSHEYIEGNNCCVHGFRSVLRNFSSLPSSLSVHVPLFLVILFFLQFFPFPYQMDDSSYRLNFDLGKKIRITTARKSM